VRDARLRPKERPADARADGRRRPNLILGGTDKPRALRLAAAWVDEYNISSTDPAGCRRIRERLVEECRAIGRDPATLEVSVMVGFLIGRDEAEFRERARAQIAMFGAEAANGEAWLDERRKRWIIGMPHEARARLAEYVASGVDRIMLQCFLPHDLDHIRLVGQELTG
jgi:alkanesulfonate monooxygenase SsuD/methylene tetrahydromethanopterin reductase-like flavin-dependent oxidoreductase (luciferase family)